MDIQLLYWLLGVAGAFIAILLGVVAYFYQRNERSNDEEVNYITDKFDDMSKVVIEQLNKIDEVVTKLETKLALEEIKRTNFQDSFEKSNAVIEKKFIIVDKNINNLAAKVDSNTDKLMEHELAIKILQFIKNEK